MEDNDISKRLIIKKALKEWEEHFFKVHECKPTKRDIEQAPDSIKDLYQKYHAAKESIKKDGSNLYFTQISGKMNITTPDKNITGQAAKTNVKDASTIVKDASTIVKDANISSKAVSTSVKDTITHLQDSSSSHRISNFETENDSFAPNVWGPELNKIPKIGKDSSANHGQKEERKGAIALLDNFGHKLFKQSSVFLPRHSGHQLTKKRRKEPQLNDDVSSQDKNYQLQKLFGVSTSLPFSSGIRTVQTAVQSEISKQSLCDRNDKMTSPHKGSRTLKEVGTSHFQNDDFKITGKLFEKALRLASRQKDNISEDVVPKPFCLRDKPKKNFSFAAYSSVGGHQFLNDFNERMNNHLNFGDASFLHNSCSDKTCTNFNNLEDTNSDTIVSTSFEQAFSSNNSECNILVYESDCTDNKAKKLKCMARVKTDVKLAQSSSQAPDENEEHIGKSISRKDCLKSSFSESYPSMNTLFGTKSESLDQLSLDRIVTDSDHEIGQVKVHKAKARRKGTIGVKRKSATVTRQRKKIKVGENFSVSEEKIDNEQAAFSDSGKPSEVSKVSKSRKVLTSRVKMSENYVRLNLRAKKFVRKRVHMTGAQWKRKQWKQKMATCSKNYSNKCFKCGAEGHWANKCPGKKEVQSSAWDEVDPVNEEGFPTLRQAAMMARGVKSQVDDFGSDDELAVEAMTFREKTENTPAPKPSISLKSIVKDVDREMQKGLAKFGFTAFKPGQKETIQRILNGQSTLVILSTGGGKSLCYQLPAYIYRQHFPSITLVISPLVSLMEDQVTGLPPGIQGACLNSNMTAAQRNSVLAAVNEGKIDFLLVSPEAVVGGGHSQQSFPSRDKLPPISFACIDEVHCLSEWSHNFRPSYLRVCKVLQEKYGVNCFLGLTATATKFTATDVAHHLGIIDVVNATIRGSPVPSNLCLSVSKDENRDEALVNLLKGKRFSECESIIIYCTRRDQVERVATLIRTCLQVTDLQSRKRGSNFSTNSTGAVPWTVESYHAGLSPAQRKQVQKQFMNGKLRIVVATVAFGMGLDKPDVRGIIHYNMPKSFESYVQEIGRAGRDGEVSQCHLFLDPQGRDLGELRRHTFSNSVDRYTLKKLLQRLFQKCRCEQVQHFRETNQVLSAKTDVSPISKRDIRVCPGHERALPITHLVQDLDVREEGIETLLCYLELHSPHLLTNLTPTYATCHVQCYQGPKQLQTIAKTCPPIAAAVALAKLRGDNFGTSNSIRFSVVEVSDSMGWNSGLVKQELRRLQWTMAEQVVRRSGVIVEFSDLAFHLLSCGDLKDEEIDSLLEDLSQRVTRQEGVELARLALLASRLDSVAHRNYWMCSDEADTNRSNTLKKHLNSYFDGEDDDLRRLQEVSIQETDESILNQLLCDIRQFIHVYGPEHSLTGRAIARIFHGIDSPRFPATTWGRVRRFWRAYLNVDFNLVLREASKLLLTMR